MKNNRTIPPVVVAAGKILALATLYFLTGKIGLMLALPPGYATLIWPPSGIALGLLLIHGAHLWPGILIGSFLLNAQVADAFNLSGGLVLEKLLVAGCIATGSTLQALLGRALIDRFVGLPLSFRTLRDVGTLFMLAGPAACLVAATVGISALCISGALPTERIVSNWLTWWMGDVLGIAIFLPMVLVAPGNPQKLQWKGRGVRSLPVLAMLMLVMPLGLTFYAWKITSESAHNRNQEEFELLAQESEQAFLYRMETYNYALLGGAGFVSGSDHVSREEWKNYVDTISVAKNFPGILGLGLIRYVADEDLASFQQTMRENENPDFTIHPYVEGRPHFITIYTEPEEKNKPAIGLNISFEDARYEAAIRARDSGSSVITKHLTLLQDEEKTPGFLLLHPLYRKKAPISTVEERRSALIGWIGAPFVARHFFYKLTQSQGEMLNIRIYDGQEDKPESLIFSSDKQKRKFSLPAYSVRKNVRVMQRDWLIVWESTLTYEQVKKDESSFYILLGGLLFTGVLGLFLLITAINQNETTRWLTEEKSFILPLIVLVAGILASFYLYSTLKLRETEYIKSVVEQETKKIEQLVILQTNEKLTTLGRMAQRWQSSDGTPRRQWHDDAENHIKQLAGLKALEWIDSSYHIRWVHPIKDNESVIGLNILSDPNREAALKDAVRRRSLTITAPFDLIQGYKGFIAYAPLRAHGEFDGFMAAVFSIDDLVNSSLNGELSGDYAIYLSYQDELFYQNDLAGVRLARWGAERVIQINDKEWVMRIVPTQAYVQGQLTALPTIVLIASLLIAALLSMTVYYVLISRVRSQRLVDSNLLKDAILSSTSAIIIATDLKGHILLVNKKAEALLGEKEEDILFKIIPRRWLKDDEFIGRARQLSEELGEEVKPNFEVFTKKATKRGIDIHEWTFISRSGHEFPVRLSVTPIRNEKGIIAGFMGVGEDISEWKRQKDALIASEETFRSALESASIGMALVGTDGRWLKVNAALCDLLGYEDNELLRVDFQQITHPDDLQEDLNYVRRMLAGEIQTYNMEKRYVRKDGHVIWANLSVSLVRNPDKSPRYFIAQIQDITERREMDRMKAEFISIVSHELRTPLTSIRGSLGLIVGMMSQDLPEKVAHLISLAHKNSERLILLINDILDIDKIASGQMRFEVRNENLAALIRQGVESNAAYGEKYKVSFKVDPVPDDIIVPADASRWQQVFSNLLSNAAKFSPEGSEVRIYTTQNEGRVRVSIKDRGPGIPDEFRTRIFGKFSQADSSITRQKGGTGLGLNISKEIIEHMGGSIGFDTAEGKGTIFWFELPVVRTDSEPHAGLPPLSEALPLILHIEDDVDFTNMLSSALQDTAKLVSATTLRTAEALLKKHQFSLIILDIGIPDGSGLTFLEKMRSMIGSRVPVLILSASETPYEVRQTVAAALVKSRVPESEVIKTILSFIQRPHHGEPHE